TMFDIAELNSVPLDEKRELLKELLSLRSSEAQGIVPLTYGQTSLWFIYQLAPASPAYNFLYAARIATPLDLDVFRRACQGLLERHPLLRARFSLHDGKPVQHVGKVVPLEIPLTEATGWSDDEVKAACRQ